MRYIVTAVLDSPGHYDWAEQYLKERLKNLRILGFTIQDVEVVEEKNDKRD